MVNRQARQDQSATRRARELFATFPYDHPQGKLRERVKELRCLYEVLAVTSGKAEPVETVCTRVIDILMRSFLHEALTMVRIELDGAALQSANWATPELTIEEPILCEGARIGCLSVAYSSADDGIAFLPEEHELVSAVTAHLAQMMLDRLLLERVTQAERVKAVGQMTGGLAHDFNNLLTVILGSAEAIRDGTPEADENHARARLIGEAADRGSAITAQLLAYCRRQPLSSQSIATAQMIRDFAPLIERAVGAQVRLTVAVARGIWPVLADRAQLENALLNLAVNARDAMEGAGLLTIDIDNVRIGENHPDWENGANPGDYVRFTVTDTGCGMSQQVAARAFEPFFSTKESKGTGLGLAGVSGFVRQSQGLVRLRSAKGHGTSISLYLPRSETAPVAARGAGPAGPARGSGEKILLVEDEPLVRQHITALLGNLGYAVMAVSSVDAALAALGPASNFDLLFSDLLLPGGVNGMELAGKALEADPRLGVLLTSGYAEEAIDFDEMPYVFIGKPYRRADVAAKVAHALRQRPSG